MSLIPCMVCDGSGADALGDCPFCHGSGNHPCDNRGCSENAVAFNEDGDALCEDCLMEWMTELSSAQGKESK